MRVFELRPIFFAVALLISIADVQAVSLRPGKTTDRSVCDLGPNTNGFLGRKMLVPAVAAHADQVDAFFRMGASFVASDCSNGQVLILHGALDVDVDVPSLTKVANSSCLAADVKRIESTAGDGEHTYPAFELRCTIAKHEELKGQLADLERADPMDSLKARLVRAVHEAGGTARSSGTGGPSKKDCSKLTLGSLIQGGACK